MQGPRFNSQRQKNTETEMLNWAIRFHQGNAIQDSAESLSHPSQNGYHQERKQTNKTTKITTNIGNYGGAQNLYALLVGM